MVNTLHIHVSYPAVRDKKKSEILKSLIPQFFFRFSNLFLGLPQPPTRNAERGVLVNQHYEHYEHYEHYVLHIHYWRVYIGIFPHLL